MPDEHPIETVIKGLNDPSIKLPGDPGHVLPEPRPIPESITYDGHNGDEVAAWAHQTYQHYDRRAIIGYDRGEDGSLRVTEHMSGHAASVPLGGHLTFTEREGLIHRDNGPEILAQDHPQTVAEAKLIQAAQRKLGVSVPQPGEMDFVNRRAAATAQTVPVTDDQLATAMQRHPSNALSRRTDYPAVRYVNPNPAAAINPSKPVYRHPPRVT